MAYTTENLISAIERRSFAPANQSTFTTAEILSIAGEELRAFVLPKVLAAREEYFVYTKDTTLVADQKDYAIPERAFGNVLREVKLVQDINVYDLGRMSPEDVSTLRQKNLF